MTRFKRWWPALKIVFGLAVLFFVGRQFVNDLRKPELWNVSLRPGWLVLSGALYLLGLGFSGLFWYRLLRAFGQRPAPLAALQGYYIGHMGKYVPGKAWALILRASYVRGPGVRVGVAVQTAFYEVLTTMATGVLVSLVLLPGLWPATAAGFDWDHFRHIFRLREPEGTVVDRSVLMLFAFTLLLPLGFVVLPPVFNRIVRRMALPFKTADSLPLPDMTPLLLLEGVALTAVEWFLFGASLWAALCAVDPNPPAWSLEVWGRSVAAMGVAYVVGFVIVVVPSGLGIREFFLMLFLMPVLGQAEDAHLVIVVTVLVLRLVWTSAEVLAAGTLYCLPTPRAPLQQPGERRGVSPPVVPPAG